MKERTDGERAIGLPLVFVLHNLHTHAHTLAGRLPSTVHPPPRPMYCTLGSLIVVMLVLLHRNVSIVNCQLSITYLCFAFALCHFLIVCIKNPVCVRPMVSYSNAIDGMLNGILV